MPSLLRLGRGLLRDEQGPAAAPQELLKLYSYDGNQFARLVRAPTQSVHSDVNVAIRVGVSPRPPSSLYTTVLTYTYAAKVWALSVLQGIQFLSPRAKPFSSDSLSAGRWGE
jgi:hypothetical protein